MASFIMDLFNGEVFELQQAPDRVEIEARAGVKRVEIAGLDQGRLVTGSGGALSISFDLVFYAENTDDRDTDYVVEAAAFLSSFTVPRVIRQEPRTSKLVPALVVFGSFLELPVYFKSVRTVFGPFDTVETMDPILARITLRAEVAPVNRVVDAIAFREGAMVRKSYLLTEGG